MLPVCIAGLVGIFWWSWKKGLVILSWVLPSLIVYSAYYWAPDGIGYGRFFLVLVPAFLMCGFWLLSRVGSIAAEKNGLRPTAAVMSLAVSSAVTLSALAVGMRSSVDRSVTAYLERALLHSVEERLKAEASPRSIIVSEDRNLLHHLQFVSDYRLYSSEAFDAKAIAKLPSHSFTDPQGWQPQQRQALYDALKDYTQRDLDMKLRSMIENALDQGETVLFVRRKPKPARSKPGAPPKKVPLVRHSVAPPEQFKVRIVYSWPSALCSPLEANKPAAWRGPQNRYKQDNWQLIQVSLRPE